MCFFGAFSACFVGPWAISWILWPTVILRANSVPYVILSIFWFWERVPLFSTFSYVSGGAKLVDRALVERWEGAARVTLAGDLGWVCKGLYEVQRQGRRFGLGLQGS